jgi:hypothetical protein
MARFSAKAEGKGWNTLDDVDVVLAVSVDHSPIERVPLLLGVSTPPPAELHDHTAAADGGADVLTIAEAKRRLALTLGVSESSIKITVEA